MQVLVDTQLKELIGAGQVKHLSDEMQLADFVQPASIDLAIGDTIYLVKQGFIPFQKSIKHIVEGLFVEEFDAHDEVMLYKGQTYVVPCLSLDLPEHLFGKVSAKSSIGRVDVLVRTIFDETGLYDTVLPSSSGQLWFEITPQSFNIKVTKGVSLSQIMFFDIAHGYKSLVDRSDEQFLFIDGAPIQPKTYEDKMLVSIGLHDDVIGYQARYTNQVIDLTDKGKGMHDVYHFFEPLQIRPEHTHKKLHLEKDTFYILATKEAIRVPLQYSIELVPFSHLVGELRVHYAGFFDPGFGGEQGATGVLEIRPHEDIVVYDGQPICLVEVFENKQLPSSAYGTFGNHYQGQQGPKLAKYFR